ncbi:hypothetical protein WN55_10650, partial [Dufourea novaeangliae]
RSPDLIPLYYFLQGNVKSLVYNSKPKSILELKGNIRQEIVNVPRSMCQRVIKNLRAQECKSQEGPHLNDSIFET